MTRRPHDKYDTPYAEAIVSPLVDFLGQSLRGTVLECCAGDGNLAGAIANSTECDVRQRDILFPDGWDATVTKCWESFSEAFDFNWTITNPPFNLALPILENAWEFSRVGVAFLLPITWNEPTKDRREWLVEHADNFRVIIPVSPRISFRQGEINPKTGKPYGSASTTVCWYVWEKNWSWRELGIKSPFQYLAGWR